MSIAEKIRAIPLDVPLREAAAMVGCNPKYVATLRSAIKKPDLYRDIANAARDRWRARNPEKVLDHARRRYHKTKVLGGPGEWPRKLTSELKRRLKRGESLGVIAKAMGFSRSTIAGRVHRLKKSGEMS